MFNVFLVASAAALLASNTYELTCCTRRTFVEQQPTPPLPKPPRPLAPCQLPSTLIPTLPPPPNNPTVASTQIPHERLTIPPPIVPLDAPEDPLPQRPQGEPVDPLIMHRAHLQRGRPERRRDMRSRRPRSRYGVRGA